MRPRPADTVTITINGTNDAPVITSNGGGASASIGVAENTTAVTTVTVTDADRGPPTFTILPGGDAAKFFIDPGTGALSFVTAPDFENPADVGNDNVYDLTVQVADGFGGFDTQALSVTVSNAADGIRVTPVTVVPVGVETLVNTTTTGVQSIGANVAQAIAADAAGNFVVVWASNQQDGVTYDVYAQRYSADGSALGSEFRVNTTTADNQLNPSLAMDAAGNFVVSWASNLQDGSGYGIYAQRFDAGGAAQGAEFLVNTTIANSQTTPVVAMSSSGSFAIAWTGSAQDPDSSSGVYAQRFDAGGVAQGGEFRVNTFTTDTQQLTSAAMDASGNFVVTWASLNQDGSNYGVYGQRFAADGSAQGAEFRVNSTVADSQLYHDVAMLADGRFVVAFQSRNPDGSFEVFMQRYAADGSAVGGETQVNTVSVSGTQAFPSISADADGNLTVVWNSSADGSGSGVVGRRLDWSGTALTPEFQVNATSTGNQLYPEVVAQPGGGFVVAWGGSGGGDADGVYLQRFGLTTDEGGASTSFRIVLDSAPTADVTIPISVSDGSEGSVSVGSVTFTAGNWNVAQTVTVTGLQDFVNDGSQRYQVVIGAATSADANFNGLDAGDLQVTNLEIPNTAPVNSVPGAQATNEDTDLVFSAAAGNSISVSDADAGNGIINVALTATGGTVTLNGSTGLSFSTGDGTADALLVFTGTIANINAALDGLVFSPTPDFNGPASLQIISGDMGNSGTGGALADADTVSITVNPVNDAPVITGGPDSAALPETDAGLSTTGTLTVGDVDTADTVTASVDSLVVSGTSNLSDPAKPSDATLLTMLGVSPTTILNNTQTSNTLTWTFDSGSEAFDYLAAGETLVLQYTVKATDDAGVPLSDTETVTITITGTNDAPTVTASPATAFTEDADASAQNLVQAGTVSFDDIDGNDVVDISAALSSAATWSGGSIDPDPGRRAGSRLQRNRHRCCSTGLGGLELQRRRCRPGLPERRREHQPDVHRHGHRRQCGHGHGYRHDHDQRHERRAERDCQRGCSLHRRRRCQCAEPGAGRHGELRRHRRQRRRRHQRGAEQCSHLERRQHRSDPGRRAGSRLQRYRHGRRSTGLGGLELQRRRRRPRLPECRREHHADLHRHRDRRQRGHGQRHRHDHHQRHERRSERDRQPGDSLHRRRRRQRTEPGAGRYCQLRRHRRQRRCRHQRGARAVQRSGAAAASTRPWPPRWKPASAPAPPVPPPPAASPGTTTSPVSTSTS